MQRLDPNEKSEVLAIKIPPKLHHWLKEECKRVGQNKSEYIRECLEAQREK